MCPQCTNCSTWPLYQICYYTRIAYLFDHPGRWRPGKVDLSQYTVYLSGTVFYAVFMSFWGKWKLLNFLMMAINLDIWKNNVRQNFVSQRLRQSSLFCQLWLSWSIGRGNLPVSLITGTVWVSRTRRRGRGKKLRKFRQNFAHFLGRSLQPTLLIWRKIPSLELKWD